MSIIIVCFIIGLIAFLIGLRKDEKSKMKIYEKNIIEINEWIRDKDRTQYLGNYYSRAVNFQNQKLYDLALSDYWYVINNNPKNNDIVRPHFGFINNTDAYRAIADIWEAKGDKDKAERFRNEAYIMLQSRLNKMKGNLG